MSKVTYEFGLPDGSRVFVKDAQNYYTALEKVATQHGIRYMGTSDHKPSLVQQSLVDLRRH